MMNGFETAWSEVTLVLFTTLVPSGVFALMVTAAYLIMTTLTDRERRAINKFLVVPLSISMLGLIASATHLGNPANALYVFMGVGRSPLSTEVFFAIIFLIFAGLFWLYSFTEKQHVLLQKVWLGAIILASIAFIGAIAFAYDAKTIISWNTVYVPLNLWFNAGVGGPLLALLTLQLAKAPLLTQKSFTRDLCFVAGISLVANIISMVLQTIDLASIKNSYYSLAEMVPFYSVVIALFAVFSVIAIALYAWPLRQSRLPSLKVSVVACIAVLAGIFLTRFFFYMMHMTVGLGV